jgi:hypothetical protein
MDLARVLANVLLIVAGLGLIAAASYRLLRWARRSTTGSHALGAVLTEVTQSAAVREAKQHKKREEDDGADPSNQGGEARR